MAEGVENDATELALQEAGCDIAQGFLIARPMSLDLVQALLADRAAREPCVGIAAGEHPDDNVVSLATTRSADQGRVALAKP